MALAKTLSIALRGVDAQIVDVEANVGSGLPGTFIVGMASAAVVEARDRIKTAALNSGLTWPKTKVTVSLLPGNLPKSGSHFDAAIALAIIAAHRGDPQMRRRLAKTMILGEVGLDGRLHPVPGVLPAMLAARDAGAEHIIIPHGNAAEVRIAVPKTVLVAEKVADIVQWASGIGALVRAEECTDADVPTHRAAPTVDMNQVVGQPEAKFAAEVAAAGGHHLLVLGPRGSGKSMIVHRLPTILPALTPQQQIETTVVHSVAGTTGTCPVVIPPVIAPHHSITAAALVGGGSGNPQPGALSLAHNGVLFLDEASEIPAQILDLLRTPLEQGCVRLHRSHGTTVFPAQFQLVLAANPCRCAAEDPAECRCSATTRRRYLNNISGPLRDRIDIFVRTYSKGPLHNDLTSEDSRSIAERVCGARQRAQHRWHRHGFSIDTNARMDPSEVRRHFPADDVGMAMLASYLSAGEITQRGVDRALKLAWTLADLEAAQQPTLDHVARALELREEIMI